MVTAISQDDRRDVAVRDARALDLSPTHRDEWRTLSPSDQSILTGEVLARWTSTLADDDYTLDEVVALERGRRRSLATIRDGIELTDQEFQLVRFLQRREGRIVTFADIVRALWPPEARGANAAALWERGGPFARHVGSVHALMHKIRRKLEIDPLRPQHIVSIRSVGYRWYSLPPSRDDGENYAERTEDARALRYEIRAARGELPPPREPDGRFTLGPNHPDYAAVDATVVQRRSRRPVAPTGRLVQDG